MVKKNDNEHSLLVYRDHGNRGESSAVSSMQHSLQHVPLTLSEVSKVNRQCIQNFIKNIQSKVKICQDPVLSCANK